MTAPTLSGIELVVPGDVEPGTGEWLAARRLGIGGSDVAAILGVSKWGGPLTVWHSKVSGYEQPVNDAMGIGTALEPWIMRKFQQRHPELHIVARPGVFRQVDAPWRLFSPDGLASTDLDSPPTVLVEAKASCVRGDDPETGWGEGGTDEIPYGYLCQVTWNCAIGGYERWELPVLFDGRDYAEYRGGYSPNLGGLLFERMDAWWATHVVEHVEPRADGLAATKRLLADRRPTNMRPTGQLPPEALAWRDTYLDLSREMKDITGQRDELANLLRQAHNTAGVEVGQVGTETVSTFTRTKTGVARLDVKGVRQ